MDKLNKSELAASYGFALSFMKSDPELWKLFNQAVKQTWTADRFVARLRGTKWFKTHSANVRNSILQEKADPATYQANVNQMYATVRDAWGSMFGNAGMSDKQLRTWAETAHRMGWSQAQLIDHMTDSVKMRKLLNKKALGGTAAQLEGQVDALVGAYGVDLGKGWKTSQISKILKGDDTIEGVQNRLRELASREYGAFKDAIASGQTVADIADPYIQKASSLLEVNPSQFSVQSKLIQRALKQKDEKSGKPAALSLADFSDMVRKDKRWQYTDNAREEVSGVVQQLAQAFGKAV